MANNFEIIKFKNRLILVSAVILLTVVTEGPYASVPRSTYPWNFAGRIFVSIPSSTAPKPACPAAGDASGTDKGQTESVVPRGGAEIGSNEDLCDGGNPGGNYCVHPAFRKLRAQ